MASKSSPHRHPRTSSAQHNAITTDAVGQFLLEKGYLLTALEFYQELVEQTGGEPSSSFNSTELFKHFSVDPTTDNIEPVSYQPAKSDYLKKEQDVKQEIKEKTEKVGLLEFQLRRANEQIEKLQNESQEGAVGPQEALNPPKKEKLLEFDKQIGSMELKALNYMIRKYLVENKYTLTAITFEDETEQKLSDWMQVGLKTDEPPGLLTFYRYFYHSGTGSGTKEQLMAKTSEENLQLRKRLSELKHNVDKLTEENRQLQDQLTKVREQGAIPIASLPPSLSLSQKASGSTQGSETHKSAATSSSSSSGTQPNSHKQNETKPENIKSEEESHKDEEEKENQQKNKNQQIRVHKARRTFLQVVGGAQVFDPENDRAERISKMLLKLAKIENGSVRDIIAMTSDMLPNIRDGVILKKRDELIPLILLTVSQHPDEKTRISLLQMLFNLIPKPNVYQRSMIVDGFISLASLISEERTEKELMSHCWNHLNNAQPEIRILSSDTCAALGRFVRPELRPSLILSIFQQLVTDRDASVRVAVARNMGMLISYFDDLDKYPQIEEVFFQLLYDVDGEVRDATTSVFMPLFVEWIDAHDVFVSRLLAKFVSEIESEAKQSNYTDCASLSILLTSLKSLISHLHENLILSTEYALQHKKEFENCFTYNETQLSVLREHFEQMIQDLHHNPDKLTHYPDLKWVESDLLNRLSEVILQFDVQQQPKTTNLISDFIANLCETFGAVYTTLVVKPFFQKFITSQCGQNDDKRGRILPIWLGSVLCNLQESEWKSALRELIIQIGNEESDWNHKQMTIFGDSLKILCMRTPKLKSQILSALKEYVAHAAKKLPALNTEEVSTLVMPALSTLSADPDRSVRRHTIKAFGTVAVNVHDDQVLEKVQKRIDTFIDDGKSSTRIALGRMFAEILPHVPADFRDKVILPRLFALTQKASTSASKQAEQGQVLFECYQGLITQELDEMTLKATLLPGLKILGGLKFADPKYPTLIKNLSQDVENALLKAKNPSATPEKKTIFSFFKNE